MGQAILMIYHKISYKNIATVISTVAMLFMIISCSKKHPDKIQAVTNRAEIPSLNATEITTVISDSGITRYRISAPEWLIYDKDQEPYWDFPTGILLEKFNADLSIDARVEGDYARYEEHPQIWELRGNVVALNQQGEQFETSQLFWNQKTERIYSDSTIKITRETSIIIGVGFESNQTMTHYTILNPQGIFPIQEENKTEKMIQSTSSIEPTIVEHE